MFKLRAPMGSSMPESLVGAGGWGYFAGGLAAYAKAFRFAEVNATFYRRIPESMAHHWRARVPADFRTFEMRIFPIPPNGDQKVQITYYQELDVDHDWGTYLYPLATSTRKDIAARTTGKFAFSLEVKSG